jgi:hypothetical protein
VDGFTVHYGPIHGPLPDGHRWHTLCACQDQSTVAMSTDLKMVDCAKCLRIKSESPVQQSLL